MDYHLAIDQATKEAGFSLWLNGDYITGGVVRCMKGRFGERLQQLVKQLDLVLRTYLNPSDRVVTIIGENVRNATVMVSLGAFSVSNAAIVGDLVLISPSTWKAMVREKDPSMKDPKGIPALSVLGWDFDKHVVQDDNHADSIMIYLAYKAKGILNDDTELSGKVRRKRKGTKVDPNPVPKVGPTGKKSNKGRKIRRRVG